MLALPTHCPLCDYPLVLDTNGGFSWECPKIIYQYRNELPILRHFYFWFYPKKNNVTVLIDNTVYKYFVELSRVDVFTREKWDVIYTEQKSFQSADQLITFATTLHQSILFL